jgi:peptidoglycan hydrolase-like protein with peptidoglycan-binding domain
MEDPQFETIVRRLQEYLIRKGAKITADGDLGMKTYAAAVAYQKPEVVSAPPAAGWRVAKSLLTLRKQLDELHPRRNKSSDGSIGDAVHASRKSDHNPWVRDSANVPVVTAMDFTHDPAGGLDCNILAAALINDPRTKYVIWDGKIHNRAVSSRWRVYTGVNKHTHHLHLSVSEAQQRFDDNKPWKV